MTPISKKDGARKNYKRKRKGCPKQKTTRNNAWPLPKDDENELERQLRLEKVVSSKHLRLAVETEEERRARLENDAAIK